MVDHLPLPGTAGTQPTLHEVWRDLTTRVTRRAAASFAGVGLFATLATRWAGLPWIVTLVAVVLMAFGFDALLQADLAADHGSRRRLRRFASAATRVFAAVAAAAIGLIVLRMIFGDRIEVMRR
ncbi:MAG TPA: hypothetical protein VGD77_12505 [Gemmatimonadaceae bacterium]